MSEQNNNQNLRIFDHAGSVELVPIYGGTPTAFFVLGEAQIPAENVDTPVKDVKKNIMYGNMPASGLTVDQGVDHSITKTLSKDFLISEWGDVPVQITMNGVSFYGTACGTDWGKANEQALDFYENYKLSAHPEKRLHLTITEGKSNSNSFICVLTKMRAVGPALDKQGTVPLYSYNMSLIGVRR